MARKRGRSEVKKLAEGEGEVKPTVEVPPLRRVTRSLTQEDAVPPPRQPPKKRARKAKTTPKKPKKTSKKKEEEDDVVSATSEKESDDDSDGGATSLAEYTAAGSSSKTTTVVIEHCKQCKSIGKRANEAQAGLEEGFPGINVLINPEKPRRGCFEIRMEGETGETFISLLNMKRPFKALKDLDMEEVASDIIKKIKG